MPELGYKARGASMCSLGRNLQALSAQVDLTSSLWVDI